MMGVFDGSVKTSRRIADPMTDKGISSVASLILPAINTPAALLYPGSDVSVVHGNQQLHVDQNRIMRVGMNQDVAIGMNETYLVSMNRTMTVMENYTRNVLANSMITVTGDYTKNIICNYMKNVTGNSTNSITGFYSKSVTQDYTKTIIGTSTSVITGTYSKTVHSDYLKHVKGTSSNTVIGDYTKILSANYVKVVTGNSSVQVASESTIQYMGNHSRTCGSDHRMLIAGSNTHTTCGPTIRNEIDVTVSQQIDSHIDVHPSDLNQEKNAWMASAFAKGDRQVFKVDFTAIQFQAEGIKADVCGLAIAAYPAYFTLYGTTNSCFISKFELGVTAGKALGIEAKSVLIEQKSELMQGKFQGLFNRVGIQQIQLGADKITLVPANIFGGVLVGFNQFM
jgi:hypothetical protein